MVDLKSHLTGEIFEPLRQIEQFRRARLNTDLDTVVWDNGADMAPEFLYEIGVPVGRSAPRCVAEPETKYGK